MLCCGVWTLDRRSLLPEDSISSIYQKAKQRLQPDPADQFVSARANTQQEVEAGYGGGAAKNVRRFSPSHKIVAGSLLSTHIYAT